MSSDVRYLTHVLYSKTGSTNDHGPWSNSEAEAEVGKLVDQGYEVVATTVTTLNSAWVRDLETVTDTRLVLVTTLVRSLRSETSDN